ncbi:hypothetical protein UFOVP1_66 [uncultured Caudovirales phage]|uniref:Zinc ribbon domain-containing protein n=1 Tax=uncultured Caudovirales phage TaxID=2100421 RepID=A0A6J5KHW2_9CAUD|nr:hypothetical protein UFOVP1_66 [uncultured Caudovirales phage]
MILVDFECHNPDCDYEMDCFVESDTPPITMCPKCTQITLHRLITTNSFPHPSWGAWND